MKRRKEPDAVSLTPMIDIVFQMIIFFVCTVDLDREKFDPEITVPKTPNTPEVIENDPRTVTIQVTKDGRLLLGSALYNSQGVYNVLRQVVNREGQNVPVLIRGDATALHKYVADLMDVVSKAGLWNISFVGETKSGQSNQR